MAEISEMIVRITADVAGLQAGLAKGSASVAGFEGRAKALGSAMTGLGMKMTKGLTLPIVAFGALGVEHLMKLESASAQTAASLKATGDASGVTTKHIEEMAHSIQNHTGIAEENVQASENMLLAFKNINSQAKFDRAVKDTQDLATKLGVDGVSAAKMLGKALNQPDQALGALSRAGIQFSAQQKAQIKAMVTGTTAAKALADMNVTLSAKQSTLLTKYQKTEPAMKALSKAHIQLNDAQKKQFETLMKGNNIAKAQAIIFKAVEDRTKGLANAMGNTSAGKLKIALKGIEDVAGNLAKILMPGITAVAEFIQKLTQRFQELSPHTQHLVSVFLLIAAAAGPVITILGGIASAVVALISPIGLAAAALVGLGAFWLHQPGSMHKVQTAFHAIGNVARQVMGWISHNGWPMMQRAAAEVASWYRGTLAPALHTVIKGIELVWHNVLGPLVGWIGNHAQDIFNVLSGPIKLVFHVISAILDAWGGHWGKAFGQVKALVKSFWGYLKSAFNLGVSIIVSVVNTITGAIAHIFTSLASTAYGWGKSIIMAVVHGLQSITPHIKITSSKIAGVSVPSGISVTFAGGGKVQGPGGPTADAIPAWLSNGEYVINSKAVSRIGLPALDAMNNANGYASGGMVGRKSHKSQTRDPQNKIWRSESSALNKQDAKEKHYLNSIPNHALRMAKQEHYFKNQYDHLRKWLSTHRSRMNGFEIGSAQQRLSSILGKTGKGIDHAQITADEFAGSEALVNLHLAEADNGLYSQTRALQEAVALYGKEASRFLMGASAYPSERTSFNQNAASAFSNLSQYKQQLSDLMSSGSQGSAGVSSGPAGADLQSQLVQSQGQAAASNLNAYNAQAQFAALSSSGDIGMGGINALQASQGNTVIQFHSVAPPTAQQANQLAKIVSKAFQYNNTVSRATPGVVTIGA